MKTDNCRAIRGEIDEANLEAPLTLKTSEHLRVCEDCRRFHDDQRTLRSLMADLETVGAPPDFDFRLRARIREKPSNGFGSLLLTARPIAAVVLISMMALVALVVKSRISATGSRPPISANSPQEGHSMPKINAPTGLVPTATGEPVKEAATAHKMPAKRAVVNQRNGNPAVAAPGITNSVAANGRGLRTRDSAATAADVVTRDSISALVLVPVDSRVFKVLIDNGRGGARTISLPPVSFGSQRLLAREAAFMPVSSSKGDW
jgi:hypothetical protein